VVPTDDALVLRPATREDLPAIAEVHIRARDAAYPAMPRTLHPPHEAHAWVAGWDLATYDVWVAESPGLVVGYARSDREWLDDLYVEPARQGTGIGSALLDLIKAQRPAGFCLWVFESNEPARGFYRRHGLVDLERTDGASNEEREPDIRMAWAGEEPLAFYRGLIDAVDVQLGDILNRRAALTRAVQRHKGTSERDPAREREIAHALAARAPLLGEDRATRIVHAIITESLDAATDRAPI
jgi:ribosomal protein S18 acetylase RimI-like enzyme/chorismate mutase